MSRLLFGATVRGPRLESDRQTHIERINGPQDLVYVARR